MQDFIRRCFILGSALLTCTAKQDKTECVFKTHGVTFDVGPLQMGMSTSYHVKDSRDTVENNYTYVFNVCGYADSPDRDCDVTVSGAGPAPAFQVFDSNKGCHRLGQIGREYAKWSLLDQDDPTYGVALTYLGGDSCDGGRLNRSMTLKFVCSSSWGNTPNAKVEENECSYMLEFQTVFGCPQECPFVDRKMCGGFGFCGMDTDNDAPRCFCNEGRTGVDCMTMLADVDQGGCNGTCIALIFVVLLLVSLLIAGGVIWYRVNKLAKLNIKFGELSDTFDNGEAVGLKAGIQH